MYYPYLRGKQNELLALRLFSENLSRSLKVCPVIEPVRSIFNSLRTAIGTMNEHDVKFYVIINPQNGDLVGKSQEIIEGLEGLNWRPAFIIDRNYLEVSDLISSCSFNDVMLLKLRGTDDNDEALRDIASIDAVTSIIVDPSLRGLLRELRHMGKAIIRIDDNFVAKKRNLDYVGLDEEPFTEEFAYYQEEGFNGFCDYTALPSDFIEGGVLPNALVIHLTYKKSNDKVFVRHFYSDTNGNNANIQGKFGEAASKAVTFFNNLNYHDTAIDELNTIFNEERYPGLGAIKKLSVLHHLELMNSILAENH